MTDPTTFLVRQLEHRQSVLNVETSEWTLVLIATIGSFQMLVALGFKVFLRTPCGVEHRHKTKTPFVIANMMTYPNTFLLRQIEHRQYSLLRQSNGL